MIIYVGRTESELLPIEIIDFSDKIRSNLGKKIILLSKEVKLEYSNLIKFVRVRLINELNFSFAVQFLKVKI